MTSRIAVIAIDAVQPRLVADFWCGVLGWRVVEEDGSVISIAPPDGSWPTIDVVAVPENKMVKNRLHLDLRADGLATSDELERLLSLGARRTDVGRVCCIKRSQVIFTARFAVLSWQHSLAGPSEGHVSTARRRTEEPHPQDFPSRSRQIV